MLINYVFMLILSIHLTTTVSVNRTSISNPETHNTHNTSSSAPLAIAVTQVNPKKIKPNETVKKVLSRKIANTSTVHEPNNDETSKVKIVTEAGVSTINKNDTPSIVFSGKKDSTSTTSTTTTTAPPTTVGNSTKMIAHINDLKKNNSTIKTSSVPQVKSSIVKSSTTSTTTSSTTTSTTTTPKPKKPTITYAVVDIPGITLDKVNADSSPASNKFPPNFSVEDPETPHVQPSQELDAGLYRNHRDYIIPIVSIIFAVPILMGMVIVAYRRFKDFWSTRHYRRMDFLVDGMYND